MARIIEGYSHLHRDYDRHMNRVKIAMLGAVASFFLTSWKSFFFFVMIGFIIYCLLEYSKAKDYKSGVDGERKMKAVTKRLNSKYTAITNVEIHHEGKSVLYDCIIVGPAGIYVVEMKNMNGTIVGSASQYELVQHKVGRNGGRYSNRIRNPIKSLAAQVHTLSTLLKHHNLGVWVSGILFFSNKDATVKIVGSSVPIIAMADKGARRLRKLLIDAESSNQPLSEQAQQKAIAVLTGKAS